MRILAILGMGGHTTELLKLIDLLGGAHDFHYAMADDDPLSADRLRRPGPVHLLCAPRGKTTAWPTSAVRTIRNGWQALAMLREVQPDAVLSTGPSVAVPTLLLARLLGVKVVFVETGSRIRTLSVSGRLAYPLSDLYLVQWPQLRERLPRAVYAGRLL
jgi:beta-1,4-N-acetylglucosaminyltransferase